MYCCGIVASSQDLAFVYAIAWTALNLLVNPYMAMFNLYSLGWGFSWLRFFSPFNYAWQVGVGGCLWRTVAVGVCFVFGRHTRGGGVCWEV